MPPVKEFKKASKIWVLSRDIRGSNTALTFFSLEFLMQFFQRTWRSNSTILWSSWVADYIGLYFDLALPCPFTCSRRPLLIETTFTRNMRGKDFLNETMWNWLNLVQYLQHLVMLVALFVTFGRLHLHQSDLVFAEMLSYLQYQL